MERHYSLSDFYKEINLWLLYLLLVFWKTALNWLSIGSDGPFVFIVNGSIDMKNIHLRSFHPVGVVDVVRYFVTLYQIQR
jgi:hypothetical protein